MLRICAVALFCACLAALAGCRKPSPEGENRPGENKAPAGAPADDDQPLTLAGEWQGDPSDKPHVRAIVIEKNEFPCGGEVRFFHKGGGTSFEKGNDSFSFDNNQVHVQDGDKIEVVSPVVWSKEGENLVGTHAKNKDVVARVKLSGRTLGGEATVPAGARLFLGNAQKITVSQLKKRKK